MFIPTDVKYLSLFIRFLLLVVPATIFYWGADNIDFFDYQFTEAGLGGFTLATYLSRLAIGVSSGIGMVMFLSSRMNTRWIWAYRIPLIILLYVSLYQAAFVPLQRCYFCYWEIISISSWQGVIVWTLLLALTWLPVLWQHQLGFQLPKVVVGLLVLAGSIAPFILNYPAHWAIYGEYETKPLNRELNLDSLQHIEKLYSNSDEYTTASKGQLLVCFSSLTCPFCTRAAYKMHLIKKKNPELRCLLVLTGDASLLDAFRRKTQCDNVPTVMVNDGWFQRATGGSVPQIYRVKDDKAFEKVSYWAMDANHFGNYP